MADPIFVDPNRAYSMSLPNMGHAVIVNNIAREQPGSTVDAEHLQTALETIGFTVQVHKDCTDQKMRKIKKWMLKEDNHKDSNCFVLVILCHGNSKGHLMDRNKSKAWDTEDIVGDLSEVDTLQGKPKLMIIQACRGTQWNDGRPVPVGTLADDDEIETTHILPDKADMFLAYATVPGYRAFAGDKSGSIYLQTFARYLKEFYMSLPLDRIYLLVKQAMVQRVQGEQGLRQCSEERNSLTYLLQFSDFHKTQQKRTKNTSVCDQSDDEYLDAVDSTEGAAASGGQQTATEPEATTLKEIEEKVEATVSQVVETSVKPDTHVKGATAAEAESAGNDATAVTETEETPDKQTEAVAETQNMKPRLSIKIEMKPNISAPASPSASGSASLAEAIGFINTAPPPVTNMPSPKPVITVEGEPEEKTEIQPTETGNLGQPNKDETEETTSTGLPGAATTDLSPSSATDHPKAAKAGNEDTAAEEGKTPERVEMIHQSTYDTGLTEWEGTRLAVTSSTSDVIMWGHPKKLVGSTHTVFHVYSFGNGKWKKKPAFPGFCEHTTGIHILPITIEEELLIVSCTTCRKIKLHDFQKGTATAVFYDPSFVPGSLCPGPDGWIFVFGTRVEKNESEILKLSCSPLAFTVENILNPNLESSDTKAPESKAELEAEASNDTASVSLCFLPTYNLLILSSPKLGVIQAISCEEEAVVWTRAQEAVPEAEVARGLVYSRQHDVILAVDVFYNRILELNPKDGAVLQTITFPEDIGALHDLSLRSDSVVMRHVAKKKEKVSMYTVAIERSDDEDDDKSRGNSKKRISSRRPRSKRLSLK